MGRLARQQRQNRIIANPHAHGGNGKTDTDCNDRFKTPVPVRVFRIRRRIPKMAPDNHGHKVRRTVNSIRNKRLGVSHNTHDKLGNGKSGVPTEPHPSHLADFRTIVLFAYTSHER